MRNIELIGIALFLFFVVIVFFYKKKKKSEDNISENFLDDTVFNRPKSHILKRSLKETIELSWKFLYEITEFVNSKFSKEEKETINILGHILLRQGMRYEHVVRLGIKQDSGNLSTNIDQSLNAQNSSQQGFIKQ